MIEGSTVLPYANGIQYLRRILKISTKDLATACGVSRRTVEGWELGRWEKQRPNAGALNVMAQLLQVHNLRSGAEDVQEDDQVATGTLTDKEKKLVRLMLDPAAQPGEVSNSAQKFAESLRRRGVRSLAPRRRRKASFF